MTSLGWQHPFEDRLSGNPAGSGVNLLGFLISRHPQVENQAPIPKDRAKGAKPPAKP
jgi:hypothetical protein